MSRPGSAGAVIIRAEDAAIIRAGAPITAAATSSRGCLAAASLLRRRCRLHRCATATPTVRAKLPIPGSQSSAKPGKPPAGEDNHTSGPPDGPPKGAKAIFCHTAPLALLAFGGGVTVVRVNPSQISNALALPVRL